jgi:hypothetical protein
MLFIDSMKLKINKEKQFSSKGRVSSRNWATSLFYQTNKSESSLRFKLNPIHMPPCSSNNINNKLLILYCN